MIKSEINIVLPSHAGKETSEPKTDITCSNTHEKITYDMIPFGTFRRLSSFQKRKKDFKISG